VIKRLFDIVASALGLLLLSIVIAVVAWKNSLQARLAGVVSPSAAGP